jgi:NTE family protein
MADLEADLVLEGGGVKGIALVGAISALEEAGYTFRRIAGTSAGAVVGALLAADVRSAELETIMRATDYRKFRDTSLVDRLGPLGQSLSVLVSAGIYEGKYLVRWLDELLDRYAAGVHTFEDLREVDPEGTLTAEQSYRLVVMTSDVSAKKLVRLPWDYRSRYDLDPDRRPISEAVRASMSIPFFFEPFRLRHGDGRTSSCLVDGGMLSNFPIEVFDRTDGRLPRFPTFGIKLSSRPEDKKVHDEVHGPFELVSAMIATMTGFHDSIHIDRPEVIVRTIFVDTFGISPVDFDLSDADRDRLFESGRTAARKFLSTWDFDDYRRRYRTPPKARRATKARSTTRTSRQA